MNNNFRLNGKLLNKWNKLGFSNDSVRLLLLIPPIQTGWAEGYMQAIERRTILNFARDVLGITPNDSVYKELCNWLEVRPDTNKISEMNEILSDWLETLTADECQMWRNRLLRICLEVAQASPQIGFTQKKTKFIHREEILQIDKISRLLSISTPQAT
jgi:hypothetical protein